MKKQKKVSALANAFISKAEEEDNEITLLKLLKLCYIAQGFSLSLLDRSIFDDDVIEAWRYGPVIPSLYFELKNNKSNSLNGKRVTYTFLSEDFDFEEVVPILSDKKDLKIVDIVWNLYGKYSATELVDMTHRRGTPWDMVYISNMNKVIPNDIIKEYYDILISKM